MILEVILYDLPCAITLFGILYHIFKKPDDIDLPVGFVFFVGAFIPFINLFTAYFMLDEISNG